MSVTADQVAVSIQALPQYKSILVAADSSDHANQATEEAVKLAGFWG